MQNEAEAERFVQVIGTNSDVLLSSASYVEAAMVASRWQDGRRLLDNWLDAAGVAIVSFDEEQARLAAEAFERFGKGRHPAGLNYGDCFAYALAKSRACPLLFKGDDFTKTDVAVA